MSVQLNGYILPDSIIDKMKRFKTSSDKANKESCFSLCIDNQNRNVNISDKNNIITSRSPYKGKMCSSIIRPRCGHEETPVGIFRTYPREEYAKIEDKDIRIAYQYGIMCVASQNEITCITRKGDYDEEINKRILLTIEQDSKLSQLHRKMSQYGDILDTHSRSKFVKLNIYKRNY